MFVCVRVCVCVFLFCPFYDHVYGGFISPPEILIYTFYVHRTVPYRVCVSECGNTDSPINRIAWREYVVSLVTNNVRLVGLSPTVSSWA